MSASIVGNASRRRFLRGALAVVALPFVHAVNELIAAPAKLLGAGAAVSGARSPYRVFNRREAAFMSAFVNALCPADRLTPDGTSCGLVAALDQELANGSTDVVDRFKAGIGAADRACQAQFGNRLDRIDSANAAAFVQATFAGDINSSGSPARWAHEVVNPVLVQACFSSAIYDGHSNRVFWKVFGNAGEAPLV